MPQPNWVPKASKHLKRATQAWCTNWIDANIKFNDWDFFKENFLSTFTKNETKLNIFLQLVNNCQNSTVDDLSERFEKVCAFMIDCTQADTIHVWAIFIKSVKEYIEYYIDTKKNLPL